jgi:hypothetical protein
MEQPDFYENTHYFIRKNQRRILVLDLLFGELTDSNTTFDGSTFEKGKLIEPLRIDTISDIYLDNFTVSDCIVNLSQSQSGFIVDINELDIKNNTNNVTFYNKLIIPNEETGGGNQRSHKGKKMNFVCTINPTTITKLSGKISLLDGSTDIFKGATNGRIVAEFVIIPKE